MSVPAYDEGLDLSEVQFPVKGALYYAPTSIPLPTDFADPAVGFVHAGYWTSDGVAENATTSTGTIRLFQNNALAAKPVTDGEYTVTVTLAQTSTQAADLWYGAEVDPVTGFVTWDPARAAGRKHFILDKVAIDPATGDPIIERSTFEGELTARGTRTTTYGSLAGYPVTITAYGAINSGNSTWVTTP